MTRSPIAPVLVFALALIGVAGYVGPQVKSREVVTASFWARKLRAPADFDLVVVGDSRAYRGLNPDLGQGLRGFNFAFSNGALTPDYLRTAAAKLRPDGRRILVLAITPHSLTPRAAISNGYVDLLRRDDWEIDWAIRAEKGMRWTAPWTAGALGEFLTSFDRNAPNEAARNPETYHSNGWVSSPLPADPDPDLTIYERDFRGNQVTQKNLEDLYRTISDLDRGGVTVLAFLMPSCAGMESLEDRLSGLGDRRDFAEKMFEAGANWRTYDGPPTQTYDGSHLNQKEAELVSRWLARQVSSL